ncbi:MAG TPA: class I SAM-dependent methyltransferase [Acidimicrobiia bacterium]|nr:class I SAM-dependent methyltransferase [Acidimicrobiia bacterium]
MTSYDSRRYALVNRWDPSHLKRIDRLIAIGDDDRVLEVGCGQGHLTKALLERGVDIIGIDANPQAAEVAGTDRVRHMLAEDLDFDDASFDYIVSVHAIEHIPPLEAALAEMARVLEPGGTAVFIYPAEPIQGLYAIPTSIILHGTPFKAREVHCHKLWPSKLTAMAAPLGLAPVASEFSLLMSPQFASVFEKT